MKNRIVLVIPFVMLFCYNKGGETYQSPSVREAIENPERYEDRYQLSGDTLTIDFGDWKSVSIVTKAVKDTLILIDENGETVYTTFKD